MLLNLPINHYVLKEMIWHDKYKKIQLKLKHKSVGPGNIANFV